MLTCIYALCLTCLVKSYGNLLYLDMSFSVIPFNKHVENKIFYLVSNLLGQFNTTRSILK